MKNELIGGSIGTALSAIGTGLQTNDVLQTISLVITIIGGLITFIIVPLVNWYKNAKKDGKIDTEELKDGVDILKDGVDNLTNDKQSVEDHIKKVEGLDKREEIKKKEGK